MGFQGYFWPRRPLAPEKVLNVCLTKLPVCRVTSSARRVPRTNQTCHQKPNPSRETVHLNYYQDPAIYILAL